MTDNSNAQTSKPDGGIAGRVVGGLSHVMQLLRFFSRLPLPALPFERTPHGQPDFARAAPLVPVVGTLLHAVGAVVLVAALWLRLPPLIAAILAVLALTWSTGAFHEDGLADTADGIGGGRQREDKLRIMRDSRIGTFGAAALFFGLTLRIALLDALVSLCGALPAAAVLIAGGGLSRGCAMLLPVALAPAHSGGAAFAAGTPSVRGFMVGLAVSLIIAAVMLLRPTGPAAILAGFTAAILVAGGAVLLASRYLGGQTGDVAGAAQQACEIAFQLAVVASLA